MTPRSSVVTLVALAAIAACAEAGGSVKGGDVSESGSVATFEMPGPVIENVGTGTTWTDLYRDVFGPTGRPGSCVYRTSCHGSPDADGVKGGGVRCYPDQKGCRQSLIDMRLVQPKDATDPEKSNLLTVLRTPANKNGIMPKDPSVQFPAETVDRIKLWIAAGAPDN